MWSPDALQGSAMAMVDVFKLINSLAKMRSPLRSPLRTDKHSVKRPGVLLRWRWFAADGTKVPSYLNADAAQPRHNIRWKGPAHIVVLPGWQAQTGPQLDACIRNAQPSMHRIAQVHALGGSVVAVQDAVALAGACGLLSGRHAVRSEERRVGKEC